MGKLKVLPASIANMIAAGEVVQRPSSVVKELMENSVDAGASKVDVVITDSGRTLIQVIDNGCGMSAVDAVLCFERHATSKIATADDLQQILTYGFRGEALASIAAVSEVTLKTRREKDESGVQVTVSNFGEVKSSSVATPVGSNFAVRNLFYNTPARRKFLKSDNVEFKHIVEEFTRVALTRPQTGFSLTHNNREVFVLKPAKSLKFRVLDLLGSNVVGDVVDIEAETSIIRVSGFVGRPDTARKTLGNQFFFVNGRYFRSAYLHKAVMKAYEELMPEGLTPSYFIFLEADPQSVDVNIHPTKTEIKFEDDSVIFQILYACIKETLGRNSFGASIDFDTQGAVDLPQLSRSFDEYRGGSVSAPSVGIDPDYNPFESDSFSQFESEGPEPSVHSGVSQYDTSKYVDGHENYGRLFEDRVLSASRAMVLQNRYILTPVASGVMVVNIRRARERILFDRNIRALSREAHITQTALFPVVVQVGVQQRPLFDENAELLQSLGFDIAPVGNDSVSVGGVPEGFSCEEGRVRQLIDDILIILSEESGALSEVLRQRVAEKFASLGASGAENLTSPQEAQRLVDTLFASDNAEFTSSGKRIVSILSMEDIDKLF